MDGLALFFTGDGGHLYVYREGKEDGICEEYFEDLLKELEDDDYRHCLIENRYGEYPFILLEFIKWMD